jgi:hypothetical protein
MRPAASVDVARDPRPDGQGTQPARRVGGRLDRRQPGPRTEAENRGHATSRGPRPILILLLAVTTFVALVVYSSHDIAVYFTGSPRPAPAGPTALGAPARAATLLPTRVTSTRLGRPPVAKFVFDPAVADRVVSCHALSTDGGRTWPPLIADVVVRPTILGGANAVAPVPGPEGRFLCADVILSGPHVAAVGDIQPAAEWDGQLFRRVGLPAASADYASDPVPTTGVANAPDGQAVAARGKEVLIADARHQAPGEIAAFAIDGRGRVVAATRRGRTETDLYAADALGAAWTPVQAPGVVRDIVAAGDRIYVAADLLGVRDAEGAWRWTPWPANVQAEHLSVVGETVMAWGRLSPATDRAGVLVISRDNGATMRVAPLDKRPVWAALDPMHQDQVLAILEGRPDDRELVRLKIE